jgi:hypothetical protein
MDPHKYRLPHENNRRSRARVGHVERLFQLAVARPGAKLHVRPSISFTEVYVDLPGWPMDE